MTYGGATLTDMERYTYDAYGTPTVRDKFYNEKATGTAYDWQHLFTGQRQDPETGLYHYRNRQYHPALGTFVTRDPIGYDAGDMSLYCYVGGSPACRTDPDGRFWLALCCGVCVASLAVELARNGSAIKGCLSGGKSNLEKAACLIGELTIVDEVYCAAKCLGQDECSKLDCMSNCIKGTMIGFLNDAVTTASCGCCLSGLPSLFPALVPQVSHAFG